MMFPDTPPELIKQAIERIGPGDYLLFEALMNFIKKRYAKDDRAAILRVIGYWWIREPMEREPSAADFKIASSVWRELTSRMPNSGESLKGAKLSPTMNDLLDILGRPKRDKREARGQA